MVKKTTSKSKTSTRVWVNTFLLILMGIIFAVITCGALEKVKEYNNQLGVRGDSEAPQICFESSTYEHGGYENTGAYICSIDTDENGKQTELTDNKSYTLFLADNMHFMTNIQTLQIRVIIYMVGIMSTMACLVSAVVYLIHNRGR